LSWLLLLLLTITLTAAQYQYLVEQKQQIKQKIENGQILAKKL